MLQTDLRLFLWANVSERNSIQHRCLGLTNCWLSQKRFNPSQAIKILFVLSLRCTQLNQYWTKCVVGSPQTVASWKFWTKTSGVVECMHRIQILQYLLQIAMIYVKVTCLKQIWKIYDQNILKFSHATSLRTSVWEQSDPTSTFTDFPWIVN